MIKPFRADLHIHSVLSPCAAIEMTPRNIVYHAAAAGIDVIAITDHNAADNVTAVLQAAKLTGVAVLPGMEVETREEIHLVVLFDKIRQMREWQCFVDRNRSPLLNDINKFGAQLVVDEEDNFIAEKAEMLLAPLTAGLEEITQKVAAIGGISIASHIDRPAYSLISQLGFIPANAKISAVEVSRRTKPAEAVVKFPAISGFPVLTCSDAHTIEDFLSGPNTVFYIEEPSVKEIIMALNGLEGRKAVV